MTSNYLYSVVGTVCLSGQGVPSVARVGLHTHTCMRTHAHVCLSTHVYQYVLLLSSMFFLCMPLSNIYQHDYVCMCVS